MTSSLPTGTVTFLFTDIEGSTQLWEQAPEAMRAALARHDSLLRSHITAHGGYVVKTTGDGLHAVFANAVESIAATLACQQAIVGETWANLPRPVRIRAGLHTGEAQFRDGDYFGPALNRAARLMSVASGGQTLLSSVTSELVRDQLPTGASLHDLGEHRLKDLARPEHIFQLTGPGLPAVFPPLKSLSSFSGNLPVQLTSFIGREKELADIKGLLQSARLVTLTGSGGTGKTRLSQEVSAQEFAAFPHGIWLVELAPLADPAQIIPTLAQIFGLQALPFTSLSSLVTDYLRGKKALLILDNCEHLIEACARLANEILHECPAIKIIASSREALGIAGEVAYRIPSLAASESTQLFVERARATNANFQLSDSNALSVAQICSRLDGIPLAIELAAARVKLLSPEQIAARLDDRFRLLIGGSRTALPRQQTLRALIDWSYDLLPNEERQLLQTASVFAGGWTLEALEAVADNPLAFEHLEQLVNKSMVVPDEQGSAMRYFMLETIRQYAREKLFESGQSSAARDRHFAYFDDLSEAMWNAYRSMKDSEFIRDMAYSELENLHAALAWGLESRPEAALHLAANFAIVSTWRGNLEAGPGWMKPALDRFRALAPVQGQAHTRRLALLARAMFAQGIVAMSTGDISLARQSLQEAISTARLIDDRHLLGYSLEMFYIASAFINALLETDAAQEGLAIFNDLNDDWGLSMAYSNMARISAARGERGESQKYFGLLKGILQRSPTSYIAGLALLGMGYDERYQGHLEIAEQHFREGLKIFRHLQHKGFENVFISELGHIARMTGDLTQAKKLYQETLGRFQEHGNRPAVAHQLECFGFIAIAEEEPQLSVKLFSAAGALREKINSQMTEWERGEYTRALAELHSMLTEAEFDKLWAEGRALGLEQAIALVAPRL